MEDKIVITLAICLIDGKKKRRKEIIKIRVLYSTNHVFPS